MPEAQARVRRGGERPATRGGIPTTTSGSDRSGGGASKASGTGTQGSEAKATAAAAGQGDDQREEPKARRGWWAGIWNSIAPKGRPLEPRRGDM